MRHDVGSPRAAPHTWSALIRIGGLVLVLAVASFVGYHLGWFDYRHTVHHVQRIQRSHSFFAFAIGFVIIYGLGTSVGFPGLPFTVASGAIFGTLLGSFVSWIGALIGATSGYWIARTVGHNVVLRWVKRFGRVDAAVSESRDFAGMLRLRLIPVIPLGTVNFVGGLAKTPFGAYMAATAIGIIPSTFIYTYFADSMLEGVGSGTSKALVSLVISSVLLILLTLIPRLMRRRDQKALASARARNNPATT